MPLALSWCAGPAALADALPPLPPRPAARLPPAAVWLALAQRALRAGSPEEALRCFDRALAHEPELLVAQLGRVACLSRLDRDAEAARALAALLERAAGRAEVLYPLARTCAREGHAALGAPLLAAAVRARPELEAEAARDALFADHPAYLMALGRL